MGGEHNFRMDEDKRVFWLHEDEWGMITLMPAENFEDATRITHKAEEFGKEHFDGFGWTDMYVIPEPRFSLLSRRIPLAAVRAVVGARLPEADRVESGIRPGEIQCPNAFAFGADDAGVFYGTQADGIVDQLHILAPTRADGELDGFWTEAFMTLGTTYRLLLADWWAKALIDLANRDAIARYFAPVQGAHRDDPD